MKRAASALVLIACASAPAVERAPTVVRSAPVVPGPSSTASAPKDAPALKLPFSPRRIFAGNEPSAEHTKGTLFMLDEDDEHHRSVDEIDLATMLVIRTLDLGAGELSALEHWGNDAYVLTVTERPKTGSTHTLRRIDLRSMKIVASATTPGAVATLRADHAFPPFITVGSRGVRVAYRGFCPNSVLDEEIRAGGCVYYETHRLSDLGKTAVHMVPLANIYSSNPVKVPDDYGELPEHTRDDRDPYCTTTGSMTIDSLWVGDRYFALKSGCCDEPGGGFFMCEAPREK